MEYRIPHVSRRMIGKVNIFDLQGDIKENLIDGIRSYIESYIKECHFNNVILNIQSVKEPETDVTHSILQILEIPKKSAVFADSKEKIDHFTHGYQSKKMKSCCAQKDIVSLFCKELIEKDKVINFNERRKSKRIKSALDAEIDFIDSKNNTVHSQAIITNISDDGIFAEYLDLSSSLNVHDLDYFKNLTARIAMQNPDQSKENLLEYYGNILRLEFSGNQAGIAIQFRK